jgi:hypothetical protein
MTKWEMPVTKMESHFRECSCPRLSRMPDNVLFSVVACERTRMWCMHRDANVRALQSATGAHIVGVFLAFELHERVPSVLVCHSVLRHVHMCCTA